ncbi:hypothetical protein MRX96_059513 [Rhipicephalus microplus]
MDVKASIHGFAFTVSHRLSFAMLGPGKPGPERRDAYRTPARPGTVPLYRTLFTCDTATRHTLHPPGPEYNNGGSGLPFFRSYPSR